VLPRNTQIVGASIVSLVEEWHCLIGSDVDTKSDEGQCAWRGYACAAALCAAPSAAFLASLHATISEGCTTGGIWSAPCTLACANGFSGTGLPHYPCTRVRSGWYAQT